MKLITIILILILSTNAYCLTPYLNCKSTENYHDGNSSESEFQIPLYNSSEHAWGHGNYLFTIIIDSDLPLFEIDITSNDVVLLKENIILDRPITYQSAGLDYSLLCNQAK